MSITAVGLQAYNNALQNFNKSESGLKQATSPGLGHTFAKTLDQSLVRDTVDRGENFGAQADFIKTRVAQTLPVGNANSFSDTISQGMDKVHALQDAKNRAIDEFASGRSQNVHELMITLQKASLTMSLTSAVRGKVLEAYKELSRIQF